MKPTIFLLLTVSLVCGFTNPVHAAGVAMCSVDKKNKTNIYTDLPFSDDMILSADAKDISGYEVKKELVKRMKLAFPAHPYPSCKYSKGTMDYGYFVVAKSDYVKDYENNDINKLGFGVGKDRSSAILALEKHLNSRNVSSHKMKTYTILREDKFGNWPTGMPTGNPNETKEVQSKQKRND